MPVSRKAKAIRKTLLNAPQPLCYYCGLPFHAFVLPKGSPYAARSRAFVEPTLEHLHPVSLKGETTNQNCVLAHSWCNVTASNKPLQEKLLLKQKLSNNSGMPPWWPLLLQQTKQT